MKYFTYKLTFLLFIFTDLANAQMSVIDDNGNTINDGAEFTFQTVSENPAKLHFYIKNDFNNQIEIKAEITEMIGADGTNVQFCIGECLFSVSEGTEVPENGTFIVDANSTTSGPGTYFWNLDDTTSPITYKFKIYMVDALGNETGTPVNITYNYNENLSVKNNSLATTKIYPSVASDLLNISNQETVNAEIFNIQGKLINRKSLASGTSTINVSNLPSGIYLIRLQDANNNSITKKFIKK